MQVIERGPWKGIMLWKCETSIYAKNEALSIRKGGSVLPFGGTLTAPE